MGRVGHTVRGGLDGQRRQGAQTHAQAVTLSTTEEDPRLISAPFRFDARRHEYIDLETGTVRPHITGMLEQAGWIDDRWFTDESKIRGTIVHELTARYDMEALAIATCSSKYRGYLLSHVAAMQVIRPRFFWIEEPVLHVKHRYGGRPDRVGLVYGNLAVVEGKSGDPTPAHPIQTALQAILVEASLKVPAESLARFALYWKANGKWKLEEHVRSQDFVEARRVIRMCC